MDVTNPPKVYEIIADIESKYPVDDVKITGGVRVWNLVRIYLYFYALRRAKISRKKVNQANINYFFDSLKGTRVGDGRGKLWFFTTSRNLVLENGCRYDRFVDPVVDVSPPSVVFEWPDVYGGRPKERRCRKNHRYIGLSIYDASFWNLLSRRLFGWQNFEIYKRKVLYNAIREFSDSANLNTHNLIKDTQNQVALFYNMLLYFRKLFSHYKPKALIFVGAYSGFNMAAVQAAKEAGVPTAELQHGFIYSHHPGYSKALGGNSDCIPDYFLAFGDRFAEIVRKGNLFDPDGVFTVGYPYLDKIRKTNPRVHDAVKRFIRRHSHAVLVTSQWSISEEMKGFFLEVSKRLRRADVGIIYKPHPNDWHGHAEMSTRDNILLVDRSESIYELLKVVDVHTTAYSTSGLEALYFGVPNVLVNMGFSKDIVSELGIVDGKSSFIANTPEEYVSILNKVVDNIDEYSRNARRRSLEFFEPEPQAKIKNFLRILDM